MRAQVCTPLRGFLAGSGACAVCEMRAQCSSRPSSVPGGRDIAAFVHSMGRARHVHRIPDHCCCVLRTRADATTRRCSPMLPRTLTLRAFASKTLADLSARCCKCCYQRSGGVVALGRKGACPSEARASLLERSLRGMTWVGWLTVLCAASISLHLSPPLACACAFAVLQASLRNMVGCVMCVLGGYGIVGVVAR
jgi:hypothetical protein